MLYSQKIGALARQIAAVVGEAIQNHGESPLSAGVVWAQVVEIAPVIVYHPSLQGRFLKNYPKIGATVGYWDRHLRDADSNRHERSRPRGVAVTAVALQNYRYRQAKKRAQKAARFPGHDAGRADYAVKYEAIGWLTRTIELFQGRDGWNCYAVTITIAARSRNECADYFDDRVKPILRWAERSGRTSDRLCYWFQTELTNPQDELYDHAAAGTEHWHGFIAFPKALEWDVLRRVERQFGTISFVKPSSDNPKKFAPVLMLPIFDALGWAEYACKGIGGEAEGARKQATGKRFRRTCGLKDFLQVNKNGGTNA